MEAGEKTMYVHTVDYRKGGDSAALINRGFWINGLPRILVACRLHGHKPVVDGTEGIGRTAGGRWVCCDRCGLRTRPQLQLDPDRWSIGDHYPDVPKTAWPSARGTLGGQLLLAKRGFQSVAVSTKLGNCGSEHMLAGHVSLGPIGALYLHTEGFGTGMQRKLNPTGYQSRVTEAGVTDGILHWALWTKRDESTLGTPGWRSGYIAVGLRNRLLGPVRYSYEARGEGAGTVRLPEGDDFLVTLRLERQVRKRRRGRGTACWRVEWSCKDGIPSGVKGSISAASVAVSDASVERGRWAPEACATIAAGISAMRTTGRWTSIANRAGGS